MSRTSACGDGMGDEPARDPRRPDGPSDPSSGRRPGGPAPLALRDFMQDGAGDTCPPGSGLVTALDQLSGPDWRCSGAIDDELIGLLGRWAAAESWVAAGKLGVARELLRRRAVPVPGTIRPGGLPEVWEEGTGHEVAAALSISVPGADTLLDLAWTLEARLPGIGAKLADGTLTYTKAKIIADELQVLDDPQAAEAEQLILAELAGKTPGQIGKLAAQAVETVDPEGAQRRRERAEREDARVRMWREHTGATALAAFGLPTDAALAANANIDQRAGIYKRSGAFPGSTMGQLRVLAFCDSINGVSADDRIAQARAESEDQAHAHDQDQPQAAAPDGQSEVDSNPPGDDRPADSFSAGEESDSDDTCNGEPDSTGPGDDGPGGSGPDGRDNGPASGPSGGAGYVLPAKSNLTFPLATLLGLAERPGEGHGLGPLDPALVRDLAAAASRSPHSEWCVTITDDNGYAIGHGCCKPARMKRGTSPPVNNRDGPWAFTRQDEPGPPGGFSCWLLTLPDGRQLTVKLGPIPVTGCDHRHESHAYQPSDTLRHLVEIRDGECTFMSCSRHARNCDFEHAIPYDKGGRTCACNAGARSRRCHKVKQSKGWTVTQPQPGWHQWQTPSGRTYANGPMKYPT
jgi:hypothetical protein